MFVSLDNMTNYRDTVREMMRDLKSTPVDESNMEYGVSYPCDFCEKSFDEKHKLKRHVRAAHTKTHACSQCSRTFSCPKDLKTHEVNVHEGKNLFECDTCGKGFSRLSNLNQHKASVHEGSRQFECDLCDETFEIWII